MGLMAEGVQILWTPWRNFDELLQNRTWLFPASAVDDGTLKSDERRKACGQVCISITRLTPVGPMMAYD